MSASLSSRKGKRSRAESEANDSFVKNVTSRMSGLLPATITRWFSSSKSSEGNGSTAVESTDSSTEDEATEGLRTTNSRTQSSQPPTKKMRYSSPGTSSYYYPETKSTSTNTETTDTYSTLQSPLKDTYKLETNYVSTPSCSPSETSTINENEKDPSVYIYQDSMTSGNNSVEQTRKSIFGSEERLQESCARTAANTYKDLTQPYFKPGLLCTPFYSSRPVYGGANSSFINRPNIKNKTKPIVKRLNDDSSINISNSTKRVMDMLENYSSPVADARRISRLINSSNDKISDTSLDTSITTNIKTPSYKTQELHVPSFASILQMKQKARLMDTTTAARQIIASHSSSLNMMPYPVSSSSSNNQNKDTSQEKFTTKIKARVTRINREDNVGSEGNTLPVVELPTVILQIDKDNLPKFSLDTSGLSSDNKKKSPERQPTNIKVVSQAILFNKDDPNGKSIDPNDVQEYIFSSPIKISADRVVTSSVTYKFGTDERLVEKSKGKNNNGNTPENSDVEEDEVEIVIPTALRQSEKSQKSTCNNCSDSENCVCHGAAESSNVKFIFNKCSDCKVLASQLTSDKCFDCDKKVNDSFDKLDSKKSQSASSIWKCQECWVNNDVGVEKCVCCGARNSSVSKPSPKINSELPKATWKCHDCWVNNNEGTDNCVCCGAKHLSTPKILPKRSFAKPQAIWKCKDCWVNNKDGVDKCVCCGAKNSITSKSLPDVNPEATWKCDVCWLKNKSNDVKCVACGGPKSGAKKQIQSKSSSPKSDAINNNPLLKDIMKSQSKKWECPICFVRNENNISKCICCEAEKPGTAKESEKKSFNFGVSPNISFKFGIDPKQNVIENKIKPIFGQATQEMETNNNHIAKIPSFTFGIPNKKPEKEIPKEENKNTEKPKPTYTFGIPQKRDAIINRNPAFQINTVSFKPPTAQSPVPNATITRDSNSEGAQEVPSVDQAKLTAASEPAAGLTGLFGSSVPSESSPNKPILNTMPVFNTPFTVESTAASTLPTSSNTNTTSGLTNVNFTITGNQPTNNMFASSISSTSSKAFQSVPSPPVTSTVTMFQNNGQENSSMSFFQTPVTTSLSIFNNNESTATTVSVSVLPSAPVYSFGANTPIAATTSKKPSFNFTFGRDNKTEQPPVFQPSFGGTPDNSASNKFMMPSSNLNSSNMLAGNNMGGPFAANNVPIMMPGGNNNPLIGLTTGNGLPSANPMNNLQQTQLNMGSNVMPNNSPTASGDMFATTPMQKENMWSTGNNNTQGSGMFGASEPSSNLQKRSFTFGANAGTPKPFSSAGALPFDNSNQSRPMFAISTQPSANPFGNSAHSSIAPNMFSSPPNNPPPSVGMFGNTNAPPPSQPPAFAFTVPSFTSFDSANMNQQMNQPMNQQMNQQMNQPMNQQMNQQVNQQMNPNLMPAFNFGAAQMSSPIFGFGQPKPPQQQQQQLHQQPQQPCNFGGGAPQVQFTLGSAPNTAGRRVRRAFRRTQR